ncbi:kinase [Micractinium conductrix]|uniref:Kinase n=1 Tax=Micractinium conductrix TaxID=554055 RepID=A0A2P6VRH4_9CHLO|nr:kinase [Micractinium conductrix]|eukprot:PSC76682.1 kinase [Micractinium conductrix]
MSAVQEGELEEALRQGDAPEPRRAAAADEAAAPPEAEVPPRQASQEEPVIITPAQFYHARDVAARLQHQEELRHRSGPEAPGHAHAPRAAAGEAARLRGMGEVGRMEGEAGGQVAAGAAIAAGQPLDEVLARVHSRAAAATGHELLTALNATAGSSVDQLITLTANITLTPADLQTFAPYLPIDGGNATLVLLGAAPDSARTRVDWGGGVAVLHQPPGRTFLSVNLELRGMAPPSAGLSRGLPLQTLKAYMWPTIDGEPGSTLAFWNCTLARTAPECGGRHFEFAVRSLQHLAVGNVQWRWINGTLACTPSGTPRKPFDVAAVTTWQRSTTGVANTADEFLFLLSSPNVTRIVLAANIDLMDSQADAFSLPVLFSGRNVTVDSNNPLELRSIAPASAVLSTAATAIEGSPLWPSVDGAPGHKVELTDCVVNAVVTPCSRNATQLTVDLLRKVVGLAEYTLHNIIVHCEEDANISLAAELLEGRFSSSAAPGSAGAAEGAAAGSGSSGSGWVIGVVVAFVSAVAVALAGVALLLWHRRRAARRTAAKPAAARGDAARPSALHAAQPQRSTHLTRMESGEVLGPATLAPQAETDRAVAGVPHSSSHNSDDTWPEEALWRSRFGVIEGLEIGELLGRGAYGKVYKGRWQGAVVAVKVVEHQVAAGDPSSVSREALLCMSVSHPNCLTTFKLSVMRLLRGEGLLESELQSSEEEGEDGAAAAAGGANGRRQLRSLLSGAEAEDVSDPNGLLPQGLYETWIVMDVHIYLCLLDVAGGVRYLHSQGIMHSDLKPANVLLKSFRSSVRGYTCKLADFGLSRILEGRATHVQTGSMGTHTHAAPELLRSGHLSPAVDAYAFGVLGERWEGRREAWELVAGEEAWQGMHPMHTILQVTQHGARPPVPPHCPPALAALMARCWAEEPADRPQFADIVPELQQQLAVVRAAQPPRPKRSASTATLPTSAALELSRAGSTAPLLLPTASGELPAVAVENTASGSPPSRQASLPHNASAPSLLQLTRAGSAAPLLPDATEASGHAGGPLAALLAGVKSRATAATGSELLAALNATAGSDADELVTLTANITLTPADLLAFAPSFPIDGGNCTVVLLGAAPGSGRTLLDFGEGVGLLFHPVNHTFLTYGLAIRGLAPASAGLAAGITTQMVGGAFWPTTLGAPSHLMAFYDTTLHIVSAGCSLNSTHFTVNALQQVLGRNDTVAMLDDHTFEVRQPLNGSYAVRVIDTGDAAGNVRWSWNNTTIACSRPEVAPPPPPSSPAEAAAVVAHHTASTGIASTADELLFLLSTPDITRVVVGGHIAVTPSSLQAYSLPIVLLGSRHVVLESNDEATKVLDLGADPRLLYLAAGSTMSFNRIRLQGAAPPSSAVANRSTIVVGSPVWPTVDGEPGHQLRFFNSSLLAYVTPCSHNSTELTKELLRKVLGAEGVLDEGETGYRIVPHFEQVEPIRSTVTREQVAVTPYTFENTVVQCQEDPQLSVAAELQREQQALGASAASGGGGGMPAWVVGIIAVAACSTAAVAALAGALLVRRKRAAVRLDAPQCPGSPRMGRMESGELAESIDKDLKRESPAGQVRLSDGTLGSVGAATTLSGVTTPSAGRRRRETLWRSRFGMIEGLEIGELLGRGAYGKVYKGRWQGAIVAVKVVEHRVAAGEPSSLSREALFCMSVSHPNCLTTFKLSVIRLLRGEGLLESEQQSGTSEEGAAAPRQSSESSDSAGSREGAGRRALRSLLSGAEAEVVPDPHGLLLPGLYESWIVSEHCDRGSLRDALSEKRLALPDGRPNLVHIYLCLLDVAGGMQYLHSQGIMHSDLKPANVLLKSSRSSVRGYTCKLADFGLSRMLEGRATHVETASMGTPTHAAPELLRSGHLSPAVDAFAFGVLAWELVAGEEAWQGMHPMQVILQVTQHGLRPPPLPTCPPALAALIARCWAEAPADRPQFSELVTELQQQLAPLMALTRAALLSSLTVSQVSPDLSTGTLPSVDEITASSSTAPTVEEEPH